MLEIISYIASGLLTILTPILFVKIVLKRNIQVSKIKSIVLIVLFIILTFIIQNNLEGTSKTIFYCILYCIAITSLYKIDYWKTILLVFLYLLLLMLADSIVVITFVFILNIGKTDFYEIYAGSIVINMLVYIITIFIAILLKKLIKKIIEYELNSNKKLIFMVALTLVCILFFFHQAFDDITINYNFYINVGIIIIFLIILFMLIKQFIINTQISLKYDRLLEFMKTYEAEIEKERIQRHETKNQLLTIKSKIYDKEKDYKVINYIDSILDEKIEVSQEHYAKFQYLPANGLKALFYFKTKEAENKNIKVSINVSKKVENSLLYNLSTNEFKQLGRLIGIYLDNAIEGSFESKDKKLGIEIYAISSDVEIIISNSYKNNKDKISTNNKSTKGKNRGHGLLLANNILNSTNKFISSKEVTNNLYIQKLIIKKSTK